MTPFVCASEVVSQVFFATTRVVMTLLRTDRVQGFTVWLTKGEREKEGGLEERQTKAAWRTDESWMLKSTNKCTAATGFSR